MRRLTRTEEQRLIDEHIAEHGVYRCRPGESTLADGGVFSGWFGAMQPKKKRGRPPKFRKARGTKAARGA